MKSQLRRLFKKILPRQVKNAIYVYRNKPLIMNWTDEEREQGLAKLYEMKTEKTLDWNNLTLFTEKLQWYKLYYKHPDLARIVDKVGFKRYIEEKLGEGYTIPLIGAWTRVDNIPWDTLPQTFVLKSNCQSDGRFIKIVRKKDEEDIEALMSELVEWLKPKRTLINSYCRAYYDVMPMILAEEYKENIAGQLYDYKAFCFSGKLECIYAASEHFSADGHINNSAISFYDKKWNKLDIRYGSHPNKDVPQPKHLTEMIKIADVLAKDFPFVRVDFFDTEEKLYLAELTFYPGGGFGSYPEAVDVSWGEKLIFPVKSPLGRKYRRDLNYMN